MDIRIGVVSTYPPTRCGIATFSSSLVGAMQDLGSNATRVVRLVGSSHEAAFSDITPEVISTIRAGDSDSIRESIRVLNGMDVAIIQHEFGIYGGPDGSEVLPLLRGLKVPSIVVLHTVLATPTGHQRMVFTEMCSRATAIVTMSRVARERLVTKYQVDPTKVSIVPHGSRDFSRKLEVTYSKSPLILTWGLIGPGKGIEWVIEAMNLLRDLDPVPRYVVVGRTHPKVFERERESYRESLQRRIDELDLSKSVQLQSEYLNCNALDKLILSSSVVVLPYDSIDQVTSGVLIEAISALRPIVATRFPHAVELLVGNAGILVPHRDPVALAAAVRRIIEQPEMAAAMSRRTSAIATELLWSSVAAKYIRLATRLTRTMAMA